MDLEKDRVALVAKWHANGIYSKTPLSDVLRELAAKRDLNPIHFWFDGALTSHPIDELCRDGIDLAKVLIARGVRPGDVIAVQLLHCRELAVICVAATIAGAVLLPLIHTLGPADVQFQLSRTDAKWFFFLPQWRKIDFLANLSSMERPESLRHCIVVDRKPVDGTLVANSDVELLSELLRSERSDVPFPQLAGDDVVGILFTSGSTSEPKGARHTHNSIRAIVKAPFIHNYGSFLCAFPAGHIAGFAALIWSLLENIEMAFLDHWDPAAAALLIEKFGLQQLNAVPLVLKQLLNAAEADRRDISSIKVCLLGATSVGAAAIRELDDRGIRGVKSYGSTEYPRVSQSHWDMPLDVRASTDGKIQEDTDVRIVDDEANDLPFGKDGEIVIRGPQLFLSYLNEEHNQSSFLPGGWFKTGDIGRLSEDGFITITDRKKDIIIRGGENISSKEVEEILELHPDIAEAAVVGTPDMAYGERVCAFLVMREGKSLTLDDVLKHFAAHLVAKFKTPERLIFVDALPRTATGKTKKEVLRAELRDV